jgi:hypothetical protein
MLRFHKSTKIWEIWNHFTQTWEELPRTHVLDLIEIGLPMEYMDIE